MTEQPALRDVGFRGAFAIGALVIGRLAIRRVAIDGLTVSDSLTLPDSARDRRT